MISVEELNSRCTWVLRRSLRILLTDGRIPPDFYFGKGEGRLLHWLRLSKLADWMNDGNRKDVLFSIIRVHAEDAGYDCVMFASDMWGFDPNERGKNISAEELEERSFDELEERGYGKKIEMIGVCGQTPQWSTLHCSRYYRDAINPDKVFKAEPPRQRICLPINQFGGRSKMFGEHNDRDMQKIYRATRKSMPGYFGKAGVDLPNSTVLVNIATEEP